MTIVYTVVVVLYLFAHSCVDGALVKQVSQGAPKISLDQAASNRTLHTLSLDRPNRTRHKKEYILHANGAYPIKDKLVFVLLSSFFGFCGCDRCYMGQTSLGILKLITFGGCGVWQIIDVIIAYYNCLTMAPQINMLMYKASWTNSSIYPAYIATCVLLAIELFKLLSPLIATRMGIKREHLVSQHHVDRLMTNVGMQPETQFPIRSAQTVQISPKNANTIGKAPLVAEFVGTFMLVFTVGCNVLNGNSIWGGVSIASVLMVMIYAFGKISGGLFNPAVSLALGIAKSLGCEKGKPWKDVCILSAVQIVAGIFAGICYYALFDRAFNLAPVSGHGYVAASAGELLYTFVLCFVVLNTAAVKASNFYYALAIGSVVIAGAYGAGALSGGCFNPAVAIGIDVIGGNNFGVGWSMIYVIAELIGAALAAGLFCVVRPEEFNKPRGSMLRSKLVSEFIGTFVLVLTVGLNVLGSSKAGAFSIAASLMCMIYALGDISGAHFNPAVTLAIFCYKRLQREREEPSDAKETGLYMVAQIFGGIVAGLTYCQIHARKSFPLEPGASYGLGQAAVAEAVYTFVLCVVVICVAVNASTKVPDFFGFAIGSCITVGGFAIGAVSGGSLNPAVSIGIASSQFLDPQVTYGMLQNQLANAIRYSSFEIVGAIFAAGILAVLLQPIVHLREQLIAEFIGTFLLVFTVGCNLLSNLGQPAWIGVSIGSVLMVMIYAFGKISGAHFNPAVSLTQGLVHHMNGKNSSGVALGMHFKTVGLYIGVQMLAGILAGIFYYEIFGAAPNLHPAREFSGMTAGVCELWYTFMLCFVIMNVCLIGNSFSPLAIGSVIVAGAYGAGAVSGGCFNPAVAVGIDVIGGRRLTLGWSMIYIPFELLGAVLAVGLFYFVRLDCFTHRPVSQDLPKLACEFIGTYMLVLTVGLNVLAKSPAAAFSIAASLLSMIYAVGDVSGANFNPAVTLAILLSEKRKTREMIFEKLKYMVVQFIAGICAAWTYMSIYGYGFPLSPGRGFGWPEVAMSEIIFTFVLCLVVLCVAVKAPTNQGVADGKLTPMFGLAIGSCITVGGLAVGAISGGSLNPAVSVGIGMSQFYDRGMGKAAIYSAFEFFGGVVAAGVVRMTHDAILG